MDTDTHGTTGVVNDLIFYTVVPIKCKMDRFLICESRTHNIGIIPSLCPSHPPRP